MSDRTRVVVARSMASIAVMGGAVGVTWLALLGYSELWQDWVIHNGLIAVGSGLIVWMVSPSQPRNAEIWVFAWAGVLTGLLCLTFAIGGQILVGLGIEGPFLEIIPAELPRAVAVLFMFVNFLWVGVLFLFTLGLALFPDGKPPTRRWRWLIWLLLIMIVALCVGLFWEARPSTTVSLQQTQDTNGGFTSLTAGMVTVGYLGLAALVPFSIAALVVRFRRSRGVERQQFRLVVWGSSIAGLLLVVAVVLDEGFERLDISLFLGLVSMAILLASFGVAIGKYRLYAIDAVINRTVVLAVLAGFITAVYAAIVVGLGHVIGANSDGLLLPIAATALVALAFEPVRHVAQRWANRVVYGRRATPYEVLSDLTQRLSHAESGAGLLDRLAEQVGAGTGADRATVWLRRGDALVVGSTWPPDVEPGLAPGLDDTDVSPVEHDGVLVGALEVVKPRGSTMSTAERHLVRDLAGSTGAVLGYQRLNDSLRHRAAELVESRARLVDAQDAERRRLERALHDGAQQLIVALKVKIGLARVMAAEHEAMDLDRLLAGLAEDAQSALNEVRDLAKGIYPPVLESDGLGSAVSSLVSSASASAEVVLETDGIGRYGRELEAAVYFDVSEAVTNAAKHAKGPIRVSLYERDGHLHFSVTDSGPGFDVAIANGGSGLQNLKDRMDAVGGALSIVSSVGSGTTVSGDVPLQKVPV